MKASELRIGNWINPENPEQVLGIMLDMVEGSRDAEILLENLHPIPLTADWLKRFGLEFGWGHYMIEYMFDKHHLRRSYDVGMSVHISEIIHVHQLQNLYFALTGEELKLRDDEKE